MINPDLGGDLPALRLGGGESDASTSLSIAERITPEKELLRDDPVPYSYSPETEIAFHTGEWATSDPSPKTDRDYFPRPQLPTQSDMPLVRNRSLPTMSDISRPNIPPPLDLSRSHMGDVDNNEDSDYSDEWVPPQIDDETGRNGTSFRNKIKVLGFYIWKISQKPFENANKILEISRKFCTKIQFLSSYCKSIKVLYPAFPN